MKDFKINEEIRLRDDEVIRLIGENELNVMTLREAKELAISKGEDLIDLNKRGDFPLFTIMEYNKYLYNLKKKNKQQKSPSLKEIRIGAQISEHDLSHKSKQIQDFLSKKMKVKITLTMKGRELANREMNKKKLLSLLVMLEEFAQIESLKDENNKTIAILTPKKK